MDIRTATLTVAVGDHADATLDALVSRVTAALGDTVAVVGATTEVHWGEGEWEGEPERSAHVTVYPAVVESVNLRALEERLQNVAWVFGQDAIAYWYGTARLVSP